MKGQTGGATQEQPFSGAVPAGLGTAPGGGDISAGATSWVNPRTGTPAATPTRLPSKRFHTPASRGAAPLGPGAPHTIQRGKSILRSVASSAESHRRAIAGESMANEAGSEFKIRRVSVEPTRRSITSRRLGAGGVPASQPVDWNDQGDQGDQGERAGGLPIAVKRHLSVVRRATKRFDDDLELINDVGPVDDTIDDVTAGPHAQPRAPSTGTGSTPFISVFGDEGEREEVVGLIAASGMHRGSMASVIKKKSKKKKPSGEPLGRPDAADPFTADTEGGDTEGGDTKGGDGVHDPVNIKIDEAVENLAAQQYDHDKGLRTSIRQLANSYFYRTGVIFILWLSLSILFYTLYVEFSVAEAFYFTVQAGLSVGFGAHGVTCEWAGCKAVQMNMTYPSLYGWNPEESSCERDIHSGKNDGRLATVCRLFTVFQVLVASSLIADALSVYMTKLVTSEKDDWHDAQLMALKELRRAGTDKSADGGPSGGAAGDTPGPDPLATPSETEKQKAKRLNFVAMIYETGKLVAMFVGLVSIGVVYGVQYEKWNFSRSLLFSTTALSTGGLEPPLLLDSNNDLDQMQLVFCAVFCLIGIPVYGIILGALASILHSSRDLDAAKVIRRQSITEGDAAVIAEINHPDDLDYIDYADYLSMELIQLGLVSPEVLAILRERWREMDFNSSGRLTAHQLRIQHAFDSIDTAKNNYIDETEFAQLCTYLSYTEDAPHPYFLPLCEDVSLFKAEFCRLGGDDGHIDRKEFTLLIADIEKTFGSQWAQAAIRLQGSGDTMGNAMKHDDSCHLDLSHSTPSNGRFARKKKAREARSGISHAAHINMRRLKERAPKPLSRRTGHEGTDTFQHAITNVNDVPAGLLSGSHQVSSTRSGDSGPGHQSPLSATSPIAISSV